MALEQLDQPAAKLAGERTGSFFKKNLA